MAIERFQRNIAPSQNLSRLHFLLTMSAIYEDSYLTPEEFVRIMDIKIEQVQTRQTTESVTESHRRRLFVRKCTLEDFKIDGRMIIHQIHQSSAKYALCIDRSRDLDGKADLLIQDDNLEQDSKFLSITITPCEESSQNLRYYGHILGQKTDLWDKQSPVAKDTVAFCRQDREGILERNRLSLVLGFNEVSYDYKKLESPIFYSYNTNRHFNIFLSKKIERKLFFSQANLITDTGFVFENIKRLSVI